MNFSRIQVDCVSFGLLAVLALTGIAPSANGASPAEGCKLYFDGKRLGPIFHSVNASTQEVHAAEELAKYLSKVFSTDWPLQAEPHDVTQSGIFVGATKVAAESKIVPELAGDFKGIRHPESYRIVVTETQVLLVGGSPQATRFAVNGFLQKELGIRWFFPGPLGEYVPSLSERVISFCDQTFEPSFWKRQVGYHSDDRDWRLRNRGSMASWKFNHAVHRFLEANSFNTNPEFFPFVDGKRRRVAVKRNQPNLAETGLAKTAARRLLDQFEGNPNQQGFSISMTDSRQFDESDQTGAIVEPLEYFRGSPDMTPLVFTFGNLVAERLFGLLPRGDDDRYLVSLAYWWAERAPEFPIHPRLIPMLTYDRAQWFDPEAREDDVANTIAWSHSGPSFLAIWEYPFGYPYLVPRHMPGIVEESIRFLHQNNARLYFGNTLPLWPYDALDNWLAMQLLWDVDADVKALTKEFFEKMYGPAKGPMEEFFHECEQAWLNQPTPGWWLKYFVSPDQFNFLTPDFCKRQAALLEKAFDRAETEMQRERITLVEAAWTFTSAGVNYYHAWKRLAGNPLRDETDRHAFENDRVEASRLRDQWLSLEIPGNIRFRIDPRAQLLGLQTEHRLALARRFEGVDKFSQAALGEPFTLPNMRWYPEKLTLGDWHVELYPAEGLKISTDRDGLRVQNSSDTRIFRQFDLSSSGEVLTRATISGKKIPGTRVELYLQFYDEKGRRLGRLQSDALPPGRFSEPLALQVGARPPIGTTSAQVGLIIRHQLHGNLLVHDLVISVGNVRTTVPSDVN